MTISPFRRARRRTDRKTLLAAALAGGLGFAVSASALLWRRSWQAELERALLEGRGSPGGERLG